MEALTDDYAEGIALDVNGYVSEGSGENIFIIRDNVIHTPMSAQSILPGFTRGAVMHIARELGYEVKETMIPREALYVADEVFLTGTAAEITPVRSIDKYPIGNEKRARHRSTPAPVSEHSADRRRPIQLAHIHLNEEDFRSMSWNTVIGQQQQVRVLRSALLGGRLAHAYLFTGPDGAGKEMVAFELAKALSCTSSGTSPEGACGFAPTAGKWKHCSIRMSNISSP